MGSQTTGGDTPIFTNMGFFIRGQHWAIETSNKVVVHSGRHAKKYSLVSGVGFRRRVQVQVRIGALSRHPENEHPNQRLIFRISN